MLALIQNPDNQWLVLVVLGFLVAETISFWLLASHWSGDERWQNKNDPNADKKRTIAKGLKIGALMSGAMAFVLAWLLFFSTPQ